MIQFIRNSRPGNLEKSGSVVRAGVRGVWQRGVRETLGVRQSFIVVVAAVVLFAFVKRH